MSMKNINFGIGLLLFAYAGLLSAHSEGGSVGNSSSTAAATDIYSITCGTTGSRVSDRLEVQIKTISPKNTAKIKYGLLTAQIFKDGLSSAPSTDPENGNAAFSPLKSLYGGNGTYQVTVSKPETTLAKGYVYTLNYHCKSKTFHTQTNIDQTQDE